jgi:hypothetical protein
MAVEWKDVDADELHMGRSTEWDARIIFPLALLFLLPLRQYIRSLEDAVNNFDCSLRIRATCTQSGIASPSQVTRKK